MRVRRIRLPFLSVDVGHAPEVRILLNRNLGMSTNKAASQAVHAALMAFDVPHGRVVVLHGSPTAIREMDVQVNDAGVTEVEPGTLTAGAKVVQP